ncbi:MAG: DEAD/DEAH box helicase [Leptospiraceae bacterium]|nr:DEAD/DEAH box helicase [Leptospiraceae bacterium]MCP5503115.1 DEAD/DEAH box helicase [Leptospiraceae bacterium]
MKFTELDLHENLHKAIADQGFEALTPIQEKAIPHILQGRDLSGLAQTGTGKTICFLLPIIQNLYTQTHTEGHLALILAPTRELVMQICEEAEKLLKYSDQKIATIIGGVGYKEQEKTLQENAALVIATPGRLIDHIRSGKLNLKNIQYFVLDEADRMFDMGFIRDIRYVMRHCPEKKQTLLFSATMSYYVIRLASDHLKDPLEIKVESEKITTDNIEQRVYHLGREEKFPYLVNTILEEAKDKDFGQGIIFTNLKMMVTDIVNTLRRFGIPATGISSMLDQKKRIKLLKDFKLGKYRYMVATDVASRGLDIESIDTVYNFDLPSDTESYVHRVGRTARAGRSGKALNFCSEFDYQELERIEKFLQYKIPIGEIREDYLKFPVNEVDNYERFNDRGRDVRSSNDSNGNWKKNNGNYKSRKKQNQQGEGPKHFHRKSKLKKFQKFNQDKPTYKENVEQAEMFLEKAGDLLPINKPVKDFPKPKKKNFKDKRKQQKNNNPDYSKKNRGEYEKSKRNLFDINDEPNKENQKPDSIWKKIRSFFGR